MRQNWQLWEGALSPSRCEEIIKLCKKECDMEPATIFSGQENNNGIRDTLVGWTGNPEIQELIAKYALESNSSAFNLNASRMQATQFGEYTKGSFYDWHHDVDFCNNGKYDRKISTLVQLSNPNDYQGGDFEFKSIETPIGFKTQGSILCFISYHEHRVTPITSGTRYSLVNWMEGERWN